MNEKSCANAKVAKNVIPLFVCFENWKKRRVPPHIELVKIRWGAYPHDLRYLRIPGLTPTQR